MFKLQSYTLKLIKINYLTKVEINKIKWYQSTIQA